ncbi:hypothetical protein Q1695_003315 [Nippostrongylus brasiliensis]|nr:hypothetical protein Q1695_003315 [Nippostrongylus brasiliensis]
MARRKSHTAAYKLEADESHCISAHNIGNVDEVPVPFDIVYGRTVDKVGADSIKIDSTRHEKTTFTVVLSVSAAREKLKPLIVFKKKNIPKETFLLMLLSKRTLKAE